MRKVIRVNEGKVMHRKESIMKQSTAKKKLTIKTEGYRKTGKADKRSRWWGTKKKRVIL